jgi:Predicted transcriptional regulators
VQALSYAVKDRGLELMVSQDNVGSIGRSLKSLRKARKLTLSQVGQMTGVSVSTLSKIENALVSPSFDIIKKICDGMDVALEGLMGEGEPVAAAPQMHGRKTTTHLGAGCQFHLRSV